MNLHFLTSFPVLCPFPRRPASPHRPPGASALPRLGLSHLSYRSLTFYTSRHPCFLSFTFHIVLYKSLRRHGVRGTPALNVKNLSDRTYTVQKLIMIYVNRRKKARRKGLFVRPALRALDRPREKGIRYGRPPEYPDKWQQSRPLMQRLLQYCKYNPCCCVLRQ